MSDDIIRLAREAGFYFYKTMHVWTTPTENVPYPEGVYTENLEHFAALVAAAERQRIAEWVEDMCAGLGAKTIANGIRNGGNDAIEAFTKETT